jgi:2-C-methyl-D-erythritol 4-phosphate cytidylyltransferase/2-C-methyl-D-erythritol 2,4-cyclodiphosphate synthase
MEDQSVAALIVAAGKGLRAGGGTPKQYRPLGGRPLLAHSIGAFARHPRVGRIQVVINPEDRPLYDAAVGGLSLPEPVAGGAARQDSVRHGLLALKEAAPDLVLVHDAARPFVSHDVITRVLDALGQHDGAIPALPISDTLKRGQDGLVVETIARDALFGAQTPQGFRYAAICDAHLATAGRALTDDAAVAEAAGLSVALVEGAPDNVKLTSAEDFLRAERMLAQASSMRIGHGFDVHRFVPGDHVWLCGVRVPHERGLEGHSDADAGLHAITDALLGAIGAGDIGAHFPPSDEKWRSASSDIFLRHAAELVRAKGGTIENVDVTLICERPKVAPHRHAMIERIAAVLEIAPSRVSVKATTSERLGFTGRGEGLAAEAVACVRLPFTADA